MIYLKWSKADPYLKAWDREIPCWCKVRNLENGLRERNEVVRSIPSEEAYSPQVFPNGRWTVGKPRARNDPYLSPFYIPTDAFQYVDVWEVVDGVYVRKTDKKVIDQAYGLHFSVSITTLGCIRIQNKEDLEWLVAMLNKYGVEEKIELEVTE